MSRMQQAISLLSIQGENVLFALFDPFRQHGLKQSKAARLQLSHIV